VIVDPAAVVLPRRLFAGPEAEREAVGFMLGRLSPEARLRSGKAAAFLNA
jgi:hypothetical protein